MRWQEPSPACPPKPVLVYFLYQMDFEFDPAKSAANLKKHGIDFVGAQVLWSDPDRLEIPARSLDEPRAPSHRAHWRSGVVGVHHDAEQPYSDYLRQASTR